MALTHTVIDDLIVGSPLHIPRTVKLEQGVGFLEKCWFTVKENRTKPDTEALIKISITGTPSSGGQITDLGGSGVGTFVFYLLRADTLKLQFRRVYIFDIWIKTSLVSDPAGTESGVIAPHYAVTLDPT